MTIMLFFRHLLYQKEPMKSVIHRLFYNYVIIVMNSNFDNRRLPAVYDLLAAVYLADC